MHVRYQLNCVAVGHVMQKQRATDNIKRFRVKVVEGIGDFEPKIGTAMSVLLASKLDRCRTAIPTQYFSRNVGFEQVPGQLRSDVTTPTGQVKDSQ
jgi:hypothetical protein